VVRHATVPTAVRGDLTPIPQGRADRYQAEGATGRLPVGRPRRPRLSARITIPRPGGRLVRFGSVRSSGLSRRSHRPIDRRSRSGMRQTVRTACLDRDAAFHQRKADVRGPPVPRRHPAPQGPDPMVGRRKTADRSRRPDGDGTGVSAGRDCLRSGLGLDLAGAGLSAAGGRDSHRAAGPARFDGRSGFVAKTCRYWTIARARGARTGPRGGPSERDRLTRACFLRRHRPGLAG
jgi:hypothetical protein